MRIEPNGPTKPPTFVVGRCARVVSLLDFQRRSDERHPR